MEPQRNIELPSVGIELSNSGNNFENNINQAENSVRIENRAERQEQALFEAERVFANSSNNTQFVQQNNLPQTQVNNQQQSVTISTPSVAADTDLVEDAWVKDLKKMILETKNDPYAREDRFKKMQVDYLKKRYNRIINGGK